MEQTLDKTVVPRVRSRAAALLRFEVVQDCFCERSACKEIDDSTQDTVDNLYSVSTRLDGGTVLLAYIPRKRVVVLFSVAQEAIPVVINNPPSWCGQPGRLVERSNIAPFAASRDFDVADVSQSPAGVPTSESETRYLGIMLDKSNSTRAVRSSDHALANPELPKSQTAAAPAPSEFMSPPSTYGTRGYPNGEGVVCSASLNTAKIQTSCLGLAEPVAYDRQLASRAANTVTSKVVPAPIVGSPTALVKSLGVESATGTMNRNMRMSFALRAGSVMPCRAGWSAASLGPDGEVRVAEVTARWTQQVLREQMSKCFAGSRAAPGRTCGETRGNRVSSDEVRSQRRNKHEA